MDNKRDFTHLLSKESDFPTLESGLFRGGGKAPEISFSIFHTRIRITPSFLLNFLAMIITVTWLENSWHPERSFWQELLYRSAIMFLLSTAVLGHVIAHIFSARYAGVPMDEILITAGLPRTLYWNDDISPDAHRWRTIGGPIFNLAGLLLSLIIFASGSGHPIVRELAEWSAAGHGIVLLFSLMPLSIVDGGSLLKWTLVSNGMAETQADKRLRRVNWLMSIMGVILGSSFIALQMWAPAFIAFGMAAIITGVLLGKLH